MIAVNDSAAAVSRVPIADLHIDPANVRRHDKRNLETIQASLRKFGQQRPILVDAKGVVIAGNGTLIAASNMGWENIDVVRSDLEGAEAIAYAIADNRTAELATWDDAALAETLAALQKDDGFDHLSAGFTDAEIEQLITDAVMPGEVVEDDVPEVQDDVITKPGDVWLLGEHRVLCGDSTKAEDVAVVMVGGKADIATADPPYNVRYEYEGHDDNRTSEAYQEFVDSFVAGALAFAPLLIVSPGKGNDRRYTPVDWVTWFKKFGLSRGHVFKAMVTEPILFVGVKPTGKFLPTDHIECMTDREPGLRGVHTCPKPVKLWAHLIEHMTGRGGVVLEMFLGSGTTLIAAEQLGRKCYGIEIEPRYCDVVVRRWQKLTGKTATRESDGAEFDG